uniref:Uncharacterized protein n=1 Tax=Rangifer tarandus platyrhynchus TaxID=3082113 RepID=A0ACB0F2X6_RANTA|nr:unnamed protein product [Rangifer tarandus platyrhynchus]
MTSWAVLLIASVLLVAPGLAFSGLTPGHHDQATAHLCEGDELCQGLSPEDPQGDLVLQREELGLLCDNCRKIIQHLEEMVGDQPNEKTIREAASKVCSKMKMLRGVCKSIMKKFLRVISLDILDGKKPQAICFDIRLCTSKAGPVTPCVGSSHPPPSPALLAIPGQHPFLRLFQTIHLVSLRYLPTPFSQACGNLQEKSTASPPPAPPSLVLPGAAVNENRALAARAARAGEAAALTDLGNRASV